MSEDQQAASRPISWPRRAAHIFGVTLTASLALALIAVGVGALHIRDGLKSQAQPNPVIRVSTWPVTWSDHYALERAFIGRLKAARETQLAFERGGLVVDIAFDEADEVRKGDTIARLETSKLDANRLELLARRDELVARRELAKLTIGRQRQLKAKGWSPQQRLDEARFNVAELDAGIARIGASIAALDVDIRKSVLKAPFDGVVAARALDEGAVVAAGSQVLTLLENTRPEAHVGVSPEAALGLKVAERYQFRANGQVLFGTLRALRRDLEMGSRTVTAIFDMETRRDVPLGELVALQLTRRIDKRGVWLPLTALVEAQKGMWAVTLAKSKHEELTIEREVVEVLHVAGTQAYVRGALLEGDQVVANGINRITPGQQVALVGPEQSIGRTQ